MSYPIPDDLAEVFQIAADLRIGDKMENGTLFAGISPDTHKPMYTRPRDERLTYEWLKARARATNFEGHGKPKGAFRVPMDDELGLLFRYRSVIGGFNRICLPHSDSWYWSSTQSNVVTAYGQRFADGYRDRNSIGYAFAVRLVCN